MCIYLHKSLSLSLCFTRPNKTKNTFTCIRYIRWSADISFPQRPSCPFFNNFFPLFTFFVHKISSNHSNPWTQKSFLSLSHSSFVLLPRHRSRKIEAKMCHILLTEMHKKYSITTLQHKKLSSLFHDQTLKNLFKPFSPMLPRLRAQRTVPGIRDQYYIHFLL